MMLERVVPAAMLRVRAQTAASRGPPVAGCCVLLAENQSVPSNFQFNLRFQGLKEPRFMDPRSCG